MAICVKDPAELSELESYVSGGDSYQLCNGDAMIYIQTWAVKEMNIQPYPEMRVYKQIEKSWRETHTGSTTRYLYFTITGPRQARLISK